MLACPHRPPCPGCPRYGEPSLPETARVRLAAARARRGHRGRPRSWRASASATACARGSWCAAAAKTPRVGIFEAGSHRLVDIPRCRVHHPLVNHVALVAAEAMRATGTAPYDERRHAGALRAIQVVVERSSQRAQVVLVGNDGDSEPLRALAGALRAELGPALHSLHWNGNPERTNVILGPHWQRLHGPEATRETIGGASVFFPPGAFGQANLDLADRIVERIHAWVPEDRARRRALRGLRADRARAPRAERVRRRSSRARPRRCAGLELGLAARPAGERARARSVAADAGRVPELVRDADLVIVDPPRSGIDAAALDALVGVAAARARST